MRKIIHLVHESLDGFIEGPNGEFDWPVMGPELSAYGFALHDRVDTFLYGRVVWDMMSSFWPNAESLSEAGKDILLTGGSNLAENLTQLGLIDEYQIVVHPVVLGGGKPLFHEPKERINLNLVGSRTFDSRTVLLHYEHVEPGR